LEYRSGTTKNLEIIASCILPKILQIGKLEGTWSQHNSASELSYVDGNFEQKFKILDLTRSS
jgi:hypothetical protein